MALGGGFLKQMNDTIKYNREILGKRKTLREIQNEHSRSEPANYESASLQDVQERLRLALKRNTAQERLGQVVAIVGLVAFIVAVIWFFGFATFTKKLPGKYDNLKGLFTVYEDKMANGLLLRTEYFRNGSKASTTYFKEGKKHQNSESYYESGSQFRSALYFDGELINEVFFFRTGGEIPNFPKLAPNKVTHLKITNPKTGVQIEFDFFDGKILPGSYHEN